MVCTWLIHRKIIIKAWDRREDNINNNNNNNNNPAISRENRNYGV